MVLPYADPASGEIRASGHRWDSRVPVAFDREWPAYLIACWRGFGCPSGRHLWDAIVATADADPPYRPSRGAAGTAAAPDENADKGEWQRFRLRLTCVRCGQIYRLDGIAEDASGRHQVDPVPLRAGHLLAQQIGGDSGASADLTTWAIHDRDDGPVVGAIHWGCTPRGRRYYAGRLDTWPDGQSVQASTPAACLRRIATVDRTQEGPTP
jgi:hypothetical protein